MRRALFGLSGLCSLFAACSGAPGEEAETTADVQSELRHAHGGFVYVESNDAAGNSVLAFRRSERGELTALGEYPTGGLGTGRGLGSQGAVSTALDGRVVLAVDAGSNELSSFAVHGAELELRSRVPSGGVRPVSVSALGPFVYVANQGEPANVVSFRLRPNGELVPMADASEALSADNANPAQVGVSPFGNRVVVSEKATNVLSVYAVERDGRLRPTERVPSLGRTPFGFAFTPRGDLVVSEAATTSASSYRFDWRGNLLNVSAAVSDLQTAPCWVAASNDSRFAYVANAGSASISGYAIDSHGKLSLLDDDGVTAATGEGSRPLDLAVDSERHLYLLDAGNHALVEYEIQNDGALHFERTLENLPTTAAGVAAH